MQRQKGSPSRPRSDARRSGFWREQRAIFFIFIFAFSPYISPSLLYAAGRVESPLPPAASVLFLRKFSIFRFPEKMSEGPFYFLIFFRSFEVCLQSEHRWLVEGEERAFSVPR